MRQRHLRVLPPLKGHVYVTMRLALLLLTLTTATAAAAAAAAAAAPPATVPRTLRLPVQLPGAPPVTMPTMSLGTAGFDNDTAATAVGNAFAAGFRAFHAAFDYNNLAGVGRGIARLPRTAVFVTAMTSPCVHSASPPRRNVTDPAACSALTESEINATLSALGVGQVDLLLLHGPSESFGFEGGCDAAVSAINQAQWRAYTAALRDGRTRSIGVSNFCQSCLRGLNDTTATFVPPSVNQVQWHVGMGDDPEGLMSFCRASDILVQAYSPLAGGAVVSDPLCTRVGHAYDNQSAAAVGLRWVIEKPQTAVVVKAKDPTYLAEDQAVFAWPRSLSAADTNALDQATEPKGQQDGRPSWGCAK